MIRTTCSALAVLWAAPVFAHTAAVPHAHSEGGWQVLFAGAVILLAGGVFAWQKRRGRRQST